MLIGFVVLIGLLAILGPIAIRTIAHEYQIDRHRRRIRKALKQCIIDTFGLAYAKQRPGKHRSERYPRAHRMCTEENPCAYRHEHIERIRATYYIRKAREEAVYRSGVIAGLHCGDYASGSYHTDDGDYSGDSWTTISFPELSTPDGSSKRLTARRTSTPMSPISV